MSDELVQILDGNTFVVSDGSGDIEASLTDPTGLFSFDTRFLSKWVLTIDGERLNALSIDDLQYFETRFFLVPGTGHRLRRRQALGDPPARRSATASTRSSRSSTTTTSRSTSTVRIEAGSDFADLFEVKDALEKKGKYHSRVERGRLVLGYKRETFVRETVISATEPAKIDEHGPHVRRARSGRTASGRPTLDVDDRRARPGAAAHAAAAREQRAGRTWSAASTSGSPRRRALECDSDSLRATYHRSLVDLAALRFSPRTLPGRSAAGGRPAVVHDHVRPRQHLHQPAGAAVRARARGDDAARARRAAGHARRRLPRRGPGPDPARDALRRDDRLRGAAALALLRLRRRDAALRRAARRVRALDRRHEARARARVRGARGAHLDRRVRRPAGQRLRRVPAPQREDRAREPVLEGLVGLDLLPRRHAAGLPARDLRAAGLRLRRQDARRPAGARASGTIPTFADRLEKEAADLKRRFNRDFWVEDGEYFALALDADGRQVDALTSNNGHLLWSGIVDKSKAKAVARAPDGRRGCSRAGACARWPRARGATTRSATTSARSGRSTTRSSPGACAATASRRRRRASRRASSTRPSSSTAACPRRSAATRAR